MTVSPIFVELMAAAPLLTSRCALLKERIATGDEAAWAGYYAAVGVLAQLAPVLAPGAGGRLMTTAEIAEAMAVSPRTILRKRRKGELQAVQLGKRGPGALRWRAPAR